MVITFAGALGQTLVYCMRLNAEPFSCADSVVAARTRVVCIRAPIYLITN